jgi:sugar fermentation stimulation protein A
MDFPQPLVPGRLKKRYKRFLADVELFDGRIVTAHCPNPGSMKTCAEPGWDVLLSPATNPARKLKWTLEIVRSPTTDILVNTSLPNAIVREGIEAGLVPELSGYRRVRPEVRYGEENSRIDLLLTEGGAADAWVEVKNATLLLGPQTAAFPDSVTKRGTRHLRELARVVQDGDRGVLFFLVSRSDVSCLVAANEIDPEYARTLREVTQQGVEVLAYRAQITTQGVVLGSPVEVRTGD